MQESPDQGAATRASVKAAVPAAGAPGRAVKGSASLESDAATLEVRLWEQSFKLESLCLEVAALGQERLELRQQIEEGQAAHEALRQEQEALKHALRGLAANDRSQQWEIQRLRGAVEELQDDEADAGPKFLVPEPLSQAARVAGPETPVDGGLPADTQSLLHEIRKLQDAMQQTLPALQQQFHTLQQEVRTSTGGRAGASAPCTNGTNTAPSAGGSAKRGGDRENVAGAGDDISQPSLGKEARGASGSHSDVGDPLAMGGPAVAALSSHTPTWPAAPGCAGGSCAGGPAARKIGKNWFPMRGWGRQPPSTSVAHP